MVKNLESNGFPADVENSRLRRQASSRPAKRSSRSPSRRQGRSCHFFEDVY